MNQFSNIHGNNKAAALIIVIFAMLVFSILGWALLNLESGDFEINLRTLNSEQALNIAEAGAQWAQNQLSRNFNCTNITNAPPQATHSLLLQQVTFLLRQTTARCGR